MISRAFADSSPPKQQDRALEMAVVIENLVAELSIYKAAA
jgi:hypothetical protein